MDIETELRREFNELAVAICVIRHEIEALPDLAGEADPFRQTREQLYRRYAELEQRLAAFPEWARRPAPAPTVGVAEAVADEPILAAVGRDGK